MDYPRRLDSIHPGKFYSWNLKITKHWKGKSSEPNLHDFVFQPFISRVYPYYFPYYYVPYYITNMFQTLTPWVPRFPYYLGNSPCNTFLFWIIHLFCVCVCVCVCVCSEFLLEKFGQNLNHQSSWMYHGIHQHVSPPFGRICFICFF